MMACLMLATTSISESTKANILPTTEVISMESKPSVISPNDARQIQWSDKKFRSPFERM